MTQLTTGQMILLGVLLLLPIALFGRLVGWFVAYVQAASGRRDAIECWLRLMRGEVEEKPAPEAVPYSREQFIQDCFSDMSIDEIRERCRALPPREKGKKAPAKAEYTVVSGDVVVERGRMEPVLGTMPRQFQLTGIQCLGGWGIAGTHGGHGENGLSAGPISGKDGGNQ